MLSVILIVRFNHDICVLLSPLNRAKQSTLKIIMITEKKKSLLRDNERNGRKNYSQILIKIGSLKHHFLDISLCRSVNISN